MSLGLKAYITGVIGAGCMVLVLALLHWSVPDPWRFSLFLLLAVFGSMLKMRLPGITGTYSASFIFILVGIAYFSLSETLVIGCVSGLVQTVWKAKKRPGGVQVLFNTASLTLSTAVCFAARQAMLGRVIAHYRPAVLALVACVFFVANTLLVSGVLSLLQRQPLKEICEQWYLWSFPYYLIGATVVGLLPLSPPYLDPASWLILLPPLYLIHFYYGLLIRPVPGAGEDESNNLVSTLPVPAKIYIAAVVAGGVMLSLWSGTHWGGQSMLRFLGYALGAMLSSTCKVRLPRMTGTLSLNFVLILAAIAQLHLSEVIIIAGIAALMQCLWNPQRRPVPVQVFFSVATLMISASLSYVLCRMAFGQLWTLSITPLLVLATAVLYITNTMMVAAVLCLVEGKPLYSLWRNCCFWSFPYYLVGAVFAGLMIVASHIAGWQAAFLVLPLLALVYVSYRLHIQRALLSLATS